MDSRRIAHVLTRIAALLELTGTDRFRARAYAGAADAIRGLGGADVAAMYRDGTLGDVSGIGPATLSVIGELIETGESAFLDRLIESVPEGLIAVSRVPGLGPAKAALLHRELGISSLDELEAAARSGTLASVRGFGEKTVRRVLRGVEIARGRMGRQLYRDALVEAERSANELATHPAIARVEPAGAVRRVADTVSEIVLVAGCIDDPSAVLRDLTAAPGVVESESTGVTSARIRYADETELTIDCSVERAYTMTLWRATGSAAHVEAVERHAAAIGFAITERGIRTPGGVELSVPSERALYEALALQWVPPELREGLGEVEAAANGELPALVTADDIRGILHCHSEWSDGSVPIAAMATAARERGLSYLGISDHSMAAFYAGGLKPDDVRRQHAEIDRLNAEATDGFRILKGIECDILGDGALDYDDQLRDHFDYVIGSIHSRFSMERDEMTARILRAMDDPRLTILAHPTGRLLLQREPYAVDLDAVIEKAVRTGVVLELNADPSRLDLDWRWCKIAAERGAGIEIGPDAHSPRGLDHVWFGVSLARKAWLTAAQVINTRDAEGIVALARTRQ